VRDPLDDWIREDAVALAGNDSIHQPGVACTRFGRQLVQVLQAPLAAQVTRIVDRGLDPQRAVFLQVILSFRARQSRDLRRPVMDSVTDGTLAG
jgi:hypothetical protein